MLALIPRKGKTVKGKALEMRAFPIQAPKQNEEKAAQITEGYNKYGGNAQIKPEPNAHTRAGEGKFRKTERQTNKKGGSERVGAPMRTLEVLLKAGGGETTRP